MHTKIFQAVVAIAIIHAVFSSLLTAEQSQLVLCGFTILRRHFKRGRNILFSFSHETHDTPQQRPITQLSTHNNHVHMVNSLLQKTQDAALWPFHVSSPDEPSLQTTYQDQVKIEYYVVIVTPRDTDEETFDEVQNHFDSFSGMKTWNQRALFLIMLTGTTKELKQLSRRIFDVLWKTENILNVVLLVPTDQELSLRGNLRDVETSVAFELYTWFPYRSGHCTSVEQITLIDQWTITNSGDFLKQVPLFPNKIPNNLQACPLRVYTTSEEPLVVVSNTKYNNTYKYSGLEIELLLIITQVMNMTIEYIPPPSGTGVLQRLTMLSRLYLGLCDLVFSAMPLNPNIMEYAEPTIPHFQTAFRWFIPCPTPVPRVERILKIFELPVWFNLFLVQVLTTAILWFSGNCNFASAEQDSPTYRTLSRNLFNVWAVLLAIPLPTLPRTTRLRAFFLLFVWYCFAINIVFQAFFITYLVEPGYRKKIETFEELTQSGLLYGYQEDTEIALNSTLYFEHTKIKTSRFYCSSHDECLERLVTQGDITMVSAAFIADYKAPKLITNYKKKIELCSLDEDIYKMFLVMYLQTGNPLLHRVNAIVRRSIEAGFVDSYWSRMKWEVRVKNMANSTHDFSPTDCNQYLQLSLSHLKLAFVILTLGYSLSSIVFIAELLHALLLKRKK